MKTIPTTFPNRPGFFPISIPNKEYRLKRVRIKENTHFSNSDKKKNKESQNNNKQILKKQNKNAIELPLNEESEKDKKQILKEQARGRKKHFEMQKPEVQKRMKESKIESEKLRQKRSIWDRLKFWARNCVKW
ncbi:MAG: hypothetical protein AB9846_01395 [Tenuifilaceae bacterium]